MGNKNNVLRTRRGDAKLSDHLIRRIFPLTKFEGSAFEILAQEWDDRALGVHLFLIGLVWFFLFAGVFAACINPRLPPRGNEVKSVRFVAQGGGTIWEYDGPCTIHDKGNWTYRVEYVDEVTGEKRAMDVAISKSSSIVAEK